VQPGAKVKIASPASPGGPPEAPAAGAEPRVISRLFIDRPIFASVLSRVHRDRGARRPASAAGRAVPRHPAPPRWTCRRSIRARMPRPCAETTVPRARAGHQRRGQHAVRALGERRQRLARDDHHVRDRHDPDLAAINVTTAWPDARCRSCRRRCARRASSCASASTSFLQIIALDSEDPRFDAVFISNYALLNVVDELRALPGVGDAQIFGLEGLLDPHLAAADRLAQLGLTPSDVAAAVAEQNAQFAAGRVGESRAPTVRLHLLGDDARSSRDPEQFERIVDPHHGHGRIVRLKDVGARRARLARVQLLGARNGKPTVPIAHLLNPAQRASRSAMPLKARMPEMPGALPPGSTGPSPTTPPCTCARVDRRGAEDPRGGDAAACLPSCSCSPQLARHADPDARVCRCRWSATFAAMLLLGFSVNTLTPVRMVLAIGIVRGRRDRGARERRAHHGERGTVPRDATVKRCSR